MSKKYSKAQTLEYVKNRVSYFKVPKLLPFKAIQFESLSHQNIIESINNNFFGSIVIRSSAVGEDDQSNSAAGEYTSVLNIPSDNPEEITIAINTVIASYKKNAHLCQMMK